MPDLSMFPRTTELKPGKTLVIRPLTAADQPALIRFMNDMPLEHRLFLRDDIANAAMIKAWCRNIDYADVIPLLGILNGEIVANGTLHFSHHHWTRHVGEIRILVGPDFRGIGIGRAIVHELFSLGISAGLERIMAIHMSSEDFLIKVLVSLGFSEAARIPRHVKDINGENHDMVVLIAEVQNVWEQQEQMITEDRYWPLSGQY